MRVAHTMNNEEMAQTTMVLVDEEVVNLNFDSSYLIEKTAGDGVKLIHHSEDEFGNESQTEITIELAEIEAIKQFLSL